MVVTNQQATNISKWMNFILGSVIKTIISLVCNKDIVYFCIEKFKDTNELCLKQYFIVWNRQLYLMYYNFNLLFFLSLPKVPNLIKNHKDLKKLKWCHLTKTRKIKRKINQNRILINFSLRSSLRFSKRKINQNRILNHFSLRFSLILLIYFAN